MSHLLVKLGTILNTIGSLGVGYYTAKHGLLVDFGAFMDAANPTHLAQIGGSLIILATGLVLRVRDLVLRADDVGELRNVISDYRRMRQDDTQEIMDLKRDKTNMLGMIKATIRPMVLEVLEEIGIEPSDHKVPPANPDFPPMGWEPLSAKVKPPEDWPEPPPLGGVEPTEPWPRK